MHIVKEAHTTEKKLTVQVKVKFILYKLYSFQQILHKNVNFIKQQKIRMIQLMN